MTVSERKKELRSVMRARLCTATSEDDPRQGIPGWLERWAGTILLFCATGGERSTQYLAEYFLQSGIPVALPRVKNQDLVFCLIPPSLSPKDAFTHLESGFRGIPEPPAHWENVCLHESTLYPLGVFIPGLAFDYTGKRLGQGGGFYDRLLAKLEPKKNSLITIGWCWPWQLVETVPTENHDRAVDCLITGSTCIFTSSAAQKKCSTLTGYKLS